MAVGVPVQDVMTRAVVTVKKTDSIQKVSQIMKVTNAAGVVVTDKGKIIGIMTQWDVIKKVLAEGKDYKKLLVEQVMSKPVKTISPDTDIETAIKLMRDLDVERLPVVSENHLVGSISARGIARIEPSLITLVKEKTAVGLGKRLEKEVMLAGECDNCSNYSEYLRNVNGVLLCEDCQ